MSGKLRQVNHVLTNMGVFTTLGESSYFIIQHGNGSFLHEVWEDQNTEDEGGNYEFTHNAHDALRIRPFEGRIELPKYLHYHTDGTHIDDLGHFLQLINGKLLKVVRQELKAAALELSERDWRDYLE